MQKKRLTTKVFSVVLSLLMMLTVIPLVPFTSTADAAYANEYYYPAGTTFVKDLFIAADSGSGDVARSQLGAYATTLLSKDLNSGAGGDWVYIGYTTTKNPAEALRGVRAWHGSNDPTETTSSGVKWNRINSGVGYAAYSSEGNIDLNKGCGSDTDDIKLFVTKDPNFGHPLTAVVVSGNTSERDNYNNSGYKPVVTFQDTGYNIDVNKGCGSDSDDIFIHYKSYSATNVQTTSLRSAYSNSAAFDGVTGYTPATASELSAARNAAKTIMDAFDNNQGYASYTQADINAATNRINNALNNLETYLYLNATENGGDQNQTIALKVGRNTQINVDLSKYTATKTGANFAGWAKSALATTGTTGTVSVGLNETYYALFGVELTANFHYLLADGSIKHEEKKTYAMNTATAASLPLPTFKDVTIDGKTYTALGWREDTQAADKTVNKTGIYTIYANNPTVDVYAVYSAPITFTQDVNKGEPVLETQTATQYINVNTEITKSSHEFTVTADTPVREGGTFIGWADSTTATESKYDAGYKFTLTDDLTIYAVYELTFVEVSFVDGNGKVISKQTISSGESATAPTETPEKAFDEDAHYVFTSWDKDFTGVKTDLTVTAVFDKIAHTIEDDITTEPTCTEAGEKDQYCTGCDYEINGIEIEALGHNKAFDPGTPATCTTDGSTDYITCLRCLEVLQEREVLPALNHDWEISIEESKAATCSTGGYEIYICKNNPNHKEKRNEVSPSAAHEFLKVDGYEATCLDNGLTDGYDCKNCGSVLVPQNIILADGHDLIIDKYVAPTCEDTGLTEGAHCEDCDYTVPQEVIPALGHDWADFTAEAATCTKPGFTAGSKCRFCHEVRDSIEIPALNHSWEIIEHPADCTTDGYTEYICAYNDAHNYTVAGEKASGHTGGTATCSEQAVCDICKEPYGKTTDHNYEAVVFEATCTKGGYTEYTCTACGDSYKGDETAVVDHTYDEGKVTVEATCDTEGEKTFTCLYCDDFYTEIIPAKGHNVDNWVVNGTEAEGDCADCGEHITANPEDVGLELPECERCGMVHRYNSGIFKYKGIYCSIVYFFRQIVNFFKGNA
ncbi:MAG: InlB B-repeat-containing protein [Clostridia bacterium]|nr:InlB B-repeat-containing protein [Clostridia bacterium]